MLQIGEVADRVELSLRTVRYYEEMGLLVPEGRTEGGFRLYTEDHVERLLIIKQMKPLGFTVQEMRELLDAGDVLEDGNRTDAEREEAADTLLRFAGAAAERVEKLRLQLEAAEGFAGELRRRARRRAAARGS